jgi:Flp pilus assembly protein TadD
MGRPEDALGPLEVAVKEAPSNAPLLLALGEAYYRTGRFSDARGRLEEAARLDRTGPSGRRAAELLKNFPK